MPRPFDIEDDDEVEVPIPLGRETRRFLCEIARATGDHPTRIAASMLHDILKDTEAAERLH